MKKLLLSECEIRVNCRDEDEAPEDLKEMLTADMIATIREKIATGSPWAWATVEVWVTDPNTGITGFDCLGACTYESEKDFRENCPYYLTMVATAFSDLNDKRERLFKALS